MIDEKFSVDCRKQNNSNKCHLQGKTSSQVGKSQLLRLNVTIVCGQQVAFPVTEVKAQCREL